MENILVVAKLSPEKEAGLKRYLKEQIISIRDGLKEIYETKLVKWRAAYEALPREETRMFPFQNASNLVVPIVAIHADTLHARIISGIFKTNPLYVAKLFGEWGEEGTELKKAYEEFMQYVGIEPQELDLYRVYSEWAMEGVKYGTSTVKQPWEKVLRDVMVPLSTKSPEAGYEAFEKDFISETVYEGPRPEKVPFDCFGIPPAAKSIEAAHFKYHKKKMYKWELLERKFSGVYDKAAVDSIINLPDRTGPDAVQQQKEQSAGAKTKSDVVNQEWNIYECYITYRHEEEAFAPRMIVTYHEKSDTILRVCYDNFRDQWFTGFRLVRRDDMYFGYGFAEILFPFQEEASQKHNNRNDNQTIANTRVWRVSPDSKLHQGYRIYPSAMLPAEKDEIEPLIHGQIGQQDMEEERLTLELAERRSGVSPPQQGFGAGVTTGKRGIYSAAGTMSMLQEGNRRTDIIISDMRDAHIRLGRVFSRQYYELGKDSTFCKNRLELFGKKGDLIMKALEAIANRKMGLPLYAATASVNKEIEKQNNLMLVQIMNHHYQIVTQMLQGIMGMGLAPQVKEYVAETIKGANDLMKSIMRDFGHDDVDILIPDPLKKGLPSAGQGQNPPEQPVNAEAPPVAGGPTIQ